MPEPADLTASPHFWLQVQFEAERAVRDQLGPDATYRWDGPTLHVDAGDGELVATFDEAGVLLLDGQAAARA